MEILQLQYFCAVAEKESVAEAARRFCVTASGITQSIRRLETELRCPLFRRGANSIALSEAGRRFYEKVAPALSLLEEARERVLDAGELPEHELEGNISLCLCTNRRLVTEAISAYRRRCGKVTFSIRHSLTDHQSVPPLREFDLIVADKLPYEEAYQKILLTEERMLLAMEENHPLAAAPVITPEMLREHKLISMKRGSRLYEYVQALFAERGLSPQIAIECEDPYYVRQYVSMGFGVAVVPEKSWRGLYAPNVRLRELGDYRRRTYLYLPRTPSVPQRVRLFIACLEEAFSREG